MYKAFREPRFVYSGLRGSVNKEILESCIGQMSDGYYENSPYWRRYWEYCKIIDFQGGAYIVVENWKYSASGFRDKDDSEIRDVFSKVIKNVMNCGFREGWFKVEKKEFPTSEEKCPCFGYGSATFADVHKAMKQMEKRG